MNERSPVARAKLLSGLAIGALVLTVIALITAIVTSTWLDYLMVGVDLVLTIAYLYQRREIRRKGGGHVPFGTYP